MAYNYKLTDLVFNDGTTIQPGKLTVFIGPNNAGKSRALKDIVAITTRGKSANAIVATDANWTRPDNLQALSDQYDIKRYLDENGNWVFRTLQPDLCSEHHTNAPPWPTWYEAQLASEGDNARAIFAEHFGKAMVAFLTTENRLLLVKEAPSPSDEREAANLLQSLFSAERATEQYVRQLVKRAFGREIALDFTVLQKLQLRVGADFSDLPSDPRDAKQIMSLQRRLDEEGDGIRSFVGIVVAMCALRRSLFLVDEPESFLHPPQAFRIGEFIAESAGSERQIIMATHSVDVLRGILSHTQDVAILRIDRVGDVNTFRLLDPTHLKNLVTDPLLSSARVLDGLFYSGAIVVEGDGDARFYHAASKRRRRDVDLHIVNADNKQTVPRIAEMYREMGVRCVGIVDFDVLNNQVEFETQLKSLGLDDERFRDALDDRGAIAQAVGEGPADARVADAKDKLTRLLTEITSVEESAFASDAAAVSAKERLLRTIEGQSHTLAESTKSWSRFKKEGRSALPPEIRLRFDRLSVLCAEQGLFINPCGELEAMLGDYGIHYTTDKRAWIRQALQLLPNIEVDDEKHPWKFLKSIHEHLLQDPDPPAAAGERRASAEAAESELAS